MDYTICDAAAAHLPQLAALERACFSAPWTRAQLAGQLPDDRHVFLIAVAGETVLGYANFLHVLDEGDIGNVAVAPEHRRQGIADALLDALCARAAALDLAFLTLEVRASNAPAIALYRKHGFQAVGQRRNYYQKPDEDALIEEMRESRAYQNYLWMEEELEKDPDLKSRVDDYRIRNYRLQATQIQW